MGGWVVKRHFRVLLWSKPCTLTWSWDQAECTVCKSMILNEKSVTSYLICSYYTILPIRYKILAVYAPVLTSTNKNDTLIYTVFTMSCWISLSPTSTVSIHSNTSWFIKHLFARVSENDYDASHKNSTRQNWWDLADTLLCQGYSASQIRDSLNSLLPGSQWFVLVQPSSGEWANSNPLDGYSDFHFQSNLCGKNLAVWTYSGPVSSCNENTAGVLARNLIDAAVSYGGSTANIRDYINNSNKVSIMMI